MSIADRVPALAYGEFRRFWGGSVVSNTGSMMYLAALGWITTDITDSAARIAAVPFIGLLPLLFVSPMAGALADRVSRRGLVLAAIVGQAAIGTTVALMVTADEVTYGRLIAASVIGGVFGSLGAPVLQAIVPELVPVHALRSAVVLNSLQFNISRALGPTTAGLLIDSVGAASVFWINAASFMAVFAAVWSIQPRPPAARTVRRSVFGDFKAGFSYARRTSAIRTALIAGGVSALLVFPIQYVAPVLATQALDLEAREYGILVGAFGTGAIIGGLALLMSTGGSFRRAVLQGLGGVSVGLAIIGGAPGLPVALVGMFVTGLMFVQVTTNILTSLQQNLDDRVRGRVMSLWMMIYGSLGPLGIMAYGAAGDVVNIQTVFLVAAALMLSYLVLMRSRQGFVVLDAP